MLCMVGASPCIDTEKWAPESLEYLREPAVWFHVVPMEELVKW